MTILFIWFLVMLCVVYFSLLSKKPVPELPQDELEELLRCLRGGK